VTSARALGVAAVFASILAPALLPCL